MSKEEIKPWPFNGYAPGNYMNKCKVCGIDKYNMDKLSFVCLECAVSGAKEYIEQVRPLAAPLEARIRELEEGLRELRRCSPVLRGDTFVCITPVKEYVNAYKDAQQLLLSGAAVGDKWIDCKERLPECGLYNISYYNPSDKYKQLYVIPLCMGRDGWYYDRSEKEPAEDSTLKVTHWQPLPAPPQTYKQ